MGPTWANATIGYHRAPDQWTGVYRGLGPASGPGPATNGRARDQWTSTWDQRTRALGLWDQWTGPWGQALGPVVFFKLRSLAASVTFALHLKYEIKKGTEYYTLRVPAADYCTE